MRLFLIFILIATYNLQTEAQNKTTGKPLFLELSLGYALTGFYSGYENYLQDGGENDGNFEVLDKTGNNFNFKARISLGVNHNNVVFTGAGFSLNSINSSIISGWTFETLENNQLMIPNFNIEVGHRFEFKSTARLSIALSNSINFIYGFKNNAFNLRNTSLNFKPGIYIKYPFIKKLNLLVDFNYNIGLTNSSASGYYFLRNNMFELNFGIIKEL